MSVKTFKLQKPKKIEQLPQDLEGKVFSEKIDGGSVVINVELPKVDVIHARNIGSKLIWNIRSYRYPELVTEIQQGNVLKNNCTYIGELTSLDQDGIGRLWTFAKRSHLENTFQIQRLSKLVPVVFFPHHIIRENGETLETLTYEQILQILGKTVKEGNHVKNIPTFNQPEPLLERKGKIEGIIINDLSRTYHFGKRGNGIYKLKFLKEKTVRFISYIKKEVGINLFTDDNKEVHLAGHKVDIAIEEIETRGFIQAEIEYYSETNLGFRDCSVKRLLTKKEVEI